MQTFVPFPDYEKSARVLDRQRLGKQRVEVMQILKALTDPTAGWQNHPATKMWRGYEAQLSFYGVRVCAEWSRRGYADTCALKIVTLHLADPRAPMPPWWGDDALHVSHQSNLLRKDPDHYGPFFPGVPDDLPYVWPVA